MPMRPTFTCWCLLLALTACDRKTEPPALAPAPAPVLTPPPPPPEVRDASAPETVDAGAPKGDVFGPDPRCPPGQFFVHGGCHTGDDVGIVGPRR